MPAARSLLGEGVRNGMRNADRRAPRLLAPEFAVLVLIERIGGSVTHRDGPPESLLSEGGRGAGRREMSMSVVKLMFTHHIYCSNSTASARRPTLSMRG